MDATQTLLEGNLATTTQQTTETLPNDRIIALIYSYLKLTPKQVMKHIPYNKDVRPLTCFKVLLLVSVSERITETGVIAVTRARTSSNGLAYLLQLAMIRQLGKPRLIKPFQRFKVDIGYMITDKGKEVLNRIIKELADTI